MNIENWIEAWGTLRRAEEELVSSYVRVTLVCDDGSIVIGVAHLDRVGAHAFQGGDQRGNMYVYHPVSVVAVPFEGAPTTRAEAILAADEHLGELPRGQDGLTELFLVPAGDGRLLLRNAFDSVVRADVQDGWASPEACPECGAQDLRFDVPTGETDCVSCGWSN